MNKKEQKRLYVLNQVISGQILATQAAEILDLSVRQTRRVLAAYRKEGAEALAHGNRERQPVHAIAKSIRERVVELASTTYAGCNHQHLSELLAEREGISISRSSVRRILVGAGLRSPRKRRPPKHRSRRERYPREGMLLQIDGSHHHWLEGRGPSLCLMGAIDDATGEVPSALFREREDAHGYFLLLRQIVMSKGIPLAIYRDQHGIFQHQAKGTLTIEEELSGKRNPTQFARLMEELGITSIAALSPQAKGRIERLWNTFQDRLVSELRIAGAKTLEEANCVLGDFLKRFNQRFTVAAQEEGTAYRRVERGVDLETIFCFKYIRTVAADNTVRLEEHRLQLLPGKERLSYSHARVEVQERLDGNLAVYYEGKCIATKPAPLETPVLRVRNVTLRDRKKKVTGVKAIESTSEKSIVQSAVAGSVPVKTVISSTPKSRPAPNHPWRIPR